MKLQKIHFFSGVIMTLFISLHLFNHLMSISGIETHIQVMNFLRPIYRNLLSESILLIAVFTQIVSGLLLFFSNYKSSFGFFEKLQIWTGLYLAFFLIIHVSAILVGRIIMELDTNFYFGAAGINVFPFNLFFIPYYGLAINAFFGHLSSIHHKKMTKSILGFSPTQQSKFILIIGLLTTVSIFYGLTDGFSGINIPTEYNALIGR